MDLEEIKAIWQDYDQRLTATKMINEKIIHSMIREKSDSTLATMRKRCLYAIILMAIIIGFCLMSIFYNAFDFEYKLQFLPLVIYVFVAATFIVYLIREYLNSKVDLYQENLRENLIRIIALHGKFMSINEKLVLLFITAGFMYLLSASIRVMLNQGVLQALIFLLGGILINLVILVTAKWLGAFKDPYGDKLKNQLKELEEFEEERIG